MEEKVLTFGEIRIKMAGDYLKRCSAPVYPTRLEDLKGQGAQLTLYTMASLYIQYVVCGRQSECNFGGKA